MKPLLVAVFFSVVASGCGPSSCPAGQTPQDTVVSDAHCGGAVTAPAGLGLPAAIPDRCGVQPSTCAFVDTCLEAGLTCSRVCLPFDPPWNFSIGVTGLPIAGAVSLPDPRVQISMNGNPVTITGGMLSLTQNGSTVTASYSVTFTTSDGSQVSIASGSYKTTVRLESRCGAV
jgi:hypothetical protein